MFLVRIVAPQLFTLSFLNLHVFLADVALTRCEHKTRIIYLPFVEDDAFLKQAVAEVMKLFLSKTFLLLLLDEVTGGV